MNQDSNWLRDRIMALDMSKTYTQPERKPVRYRKSPSPVKHPTKTCAAILKHAREHGFELPGPDENYRIARIYAGHHQRSAGAWSWSLMWDHSKGQSPSLEASGYLGSRWPASECAKPGVKFHRGIGYGTEMIPAGANYI